MKQKIPEQKEMNVVSRREMEGCSQSSASSRGIFPASPPTDPATSHRVPVALKALPFSLESFLTDHISL